MPYPLILERCFNTPLLIETTKLEILTSDVFIKLLIGEDIDRSAKTPTVEDRFVIPGNTKLITISGSLVNKNGAGASGSISYERIRSEIYSAIQDKVDNILFDIGSSGGEAAGNFPLADLIHSLPTKYGINTYGFTDSIAASGAYSLLAATQKIFAVDMAILGSIGAVATLADTTKLDEKAGIGFKIIRSRDKKQVYNQHEGISQEAIDDVTAKIKAWDNKFVQSLVKYRPQITEQHINELDGATVTAEEGLKFGLVDEIIGSIEDIFPVLENNNIPLISTGNKPMATLEETQAKLIDAQTELSSLKASKDFDIKQAVQEERVRCTKILEAQAAFNISSSSALNAINKGFSLEVVTEMFTEIKANMDESTAIITATAPQGSVTPADIAKLASQQQDAKIKDLGGGSYSMQDLLAGMADISKQMHGGV